MKPAIVVFLKEARENLRDRKTVLNALVMGPLFGPIFFAIMMGFIINKQLDSAEKPLVLPVVGAAHAPNLVAWLERQGVPADKEVERVELDGIVASAVAPAVSAFGFVFLNAPGIGEHEFQQVAGFDRAPDRPGKAFGHQPRQQAAVIDMGMAEHHRIDRLGIERQGLVVERLERAGSLKQPAIDQDAGITRSEFKAGSGHGPGRTVN